MGKIVCLMGKSSTGKDTIFKEILKGDNFKKWELQTIVPYTTRPIRSGETEGVEYHFTDEEGFLRLKNLGKIVEDRAYDTCFGIWRYFTVDDGAIDLAGHNYLFIGTLEAYEKIRDYFGTDRVLPIYVDVDDGERLARALKRERKQENPKYEEMCRRFLADCADFSKENLEKAGIDRSFINEDLQTCIHDIEVFLEAQM